MRQALTASSAPLLTRVACRILPDSSDGGVPSIDSAFLAALLAALAASSRVRAASWVFSQSWYALSLDAGGMSAMPEAILLTCVVSSFLGFLVISERMMSRPLVFIDAETCVFSLASLLASFSVAASTSISASKRYFFFTRYFILLFFYGIRSVNLRCFCRSPYFFSIFVRTSFSVLVFQFGFLSNSL